MKKENEVKNPNRNKRAFGSWSSGQKQGEPSSKRFKGSGANGNATNFHQSGQGKKSKFGIKRRFTPKAYLAEEEMNRSCSKSDPDNDDEKNGLVKLIADSGASEYMSYT